MARELSDYLDLTPASARAQWRAVLARVPGVARQAPFEPVEVILCYGLFHLVDPHRYGGSDITAVPAEVHTLSALFVRSLGSIANFGHACAFCGFSARELPSHRMLVASHIKPWAVSTDTERLDYRNGVAACPTHDSAFDTGLITVNGGLRIHRAAKLDAAMQSPGVSAYFGAPMLRTVLAIPERASAPRKAYFDYHREHVFRGAA